MQPQTICGAHIWQGTHTCMYTCINAYMHKYIHAHTCRQYQQCARISVWLSLSRAHTKNWGTYTHKRMFWHAYTKKTEAWWKACAGNLRECIHAHFLHTHRHVHANAVSRPTVTKHTQNTRALIMCTMCLQIQMRTHMMYALKHVYWTCIHIYLWSTHMHVWYVKTWFAHFTYVYICYVYTYIHHINIYIWKMHVNAYFDAYMHAHTPRESKKRSTHFAKQVCSAAVTMCMHVCMYVCMYVCM